MKLEEESRLLDVRAAKIAHLEGQLRDIAYSTIQGRYIFNSKVPGEYVGSNELEDIVLEHGQNLFEIHIEGMVLSDLGISLIKKSENIF